MKGLLFGLCLVQFIISTVVAQDTTASKQKTILVIPFNRFEFHTEIDLSIINKVNNCVGDAFYGELLNELANVFDSMSNEIIVYKFIDEGDLSRLSSSMKYKLIPKTGHYGCAVEQLDNEVLLDILFKNKCDYFLTISWYRIFSSKTSVKIEKVKKIGLYSVHLIDYDVYSDQKELLNSETGIKFSVPPSADNYMYFGLRLKELHKEYKLLVGKITANLID